MLNMTASSLKFFDNFRRRLIECTKEVLESKVLVSKCHENKKSLNHGLDKVSKI